MKPGTSGPSRGATIAVALAGLPPWLLAQGLALAMTGGGHGWTAPFWYSLTLAVFYPIACMRLLAMGESGVVPDLIVLGIAAVLNVTLLENIVSGERNYFLTMWRTGPFFVVAWLVLWAGWQLMIAASLLTRALSR